MKLAALLVAALLGGAGCAATPADPPGPMCAPIARYTEYELTVLILEITRLNPRSFLALRFIPEALAVRAWTRDVCLKDPHAGYADEAAGFFRLPPRIDTGATP
jgi:hypothetical protein